MNLPCFNIAAVERDTGLSKDVLRMWERRYGFPTPERDANGERLYPHDQVEKLRLIKRLMDQGHRPGKLMRLASDDLLALAHRAPDRAESSSSPADDHLEDLLELIRQHDSVGYLLGMQQRLGRQGLQRFVQDTLAPLTHEVGKAWEDGRIEVFEEHLFTELTTRLLRQAIAALPTGTRPRVMLTSVPEEQHALGLLMVESLLALEGAECVPQGTQMPLLEIAHAAEAHRIDIVALSFSIAFPQRQISGLLRHLRQLLPGHVALWVGGEGIRRATPLEGVDYLPGLTDAAAATGAWRKAHP
ncbi:MerR family transcriptional regulator [Azoarcus sp. KH32C]|uniref:MerR family transcriptional regulator n=1 Tax=Azoarcus sp. KH32C TaxID=748247 RepID=UPI0002385D4A|nr:MerR family transcriptional regulator [Azoarcus sp. KH32C]BAL27531.1 transcriptional regulator, MerR family [Azoarcus sp. KH32C]